MFRSRSSKWTKILLPLSLVLLSGLVAWGILRPAVKETPPAPDANPLAAAWELAQAVKQYDFSVEAQQILRPRPIPGMIGQSGQAVDINIDGEALSAVSARMTVKLDGAGLDSTPVTLLQEGSQTWLIKGDEKKLTRNPVGVMAPTGSYISYLAAADNVQPCADDSALAGAAACYTFDINGPHFADYIRDQLQTAIDNDPTARPLGAEVQIAPSPQLIKMDGSGMVILDAHNLPLRMVLDIDTPEVDPSFDGKNHAVVDFVFDPDAVEAAMAAQSGAEPFWSRFDPTQADFSALIAFMSALVPVSLLVVWHRRRWFYGFLALMVISSMVATPLVQAADVNRYVQRQSDAAQTMAGAFTSTAADAPAAAVPAPPTTPDSAPAAAPVFEPDAYCGKDSDVNRDSDGDGLADDAEYCLGTNPYKADSDFDGLKDGVETTGFDFNGQTWYSDPLKPDSNADGLNDSVEWKAADGAAADWDIDNDGTPNLWDFDDDGDGVDDGLDSSPYSATDFMTQDEFSFDVISQYDGYIYIDMQLQPQDSSHLRYGTTALNWLPDWRGQITDMDNSQDDIELIPMLEVDTNIPPSRDLADEYNISVFTDTLGIGFQRMNIPLYPVSDGGNVQAFSFRLVYGPDQLQSLGDDGIHWANARLVWSVRAKLDKDVNDNITTKTSPIHMYSEDAFRLTGWSVTKSGPYRSALIGTPDTPADDRDLFQVLFGLSSSFLTNPSITLDEVNSRLSGINTPIEQRWGVSANVKVDLPIQPDAHQSAGLVAMNDRINSFLGANYPGTTPHTVIIAAESVMGMIDQDDLGLLMPDSTNLSVNLRNVSMARQRTLTLHMRDGTKAVQGDKLLSAVLARYVNDVDTALDDLTDQYPLLTAGDMVSILQTMYLTWENGRTRLLSFDGTVSDPTVLTDSEIYEILYTTPRDRYGEPENIATLPGYLVEVGRFARENSGMIFAGGPGQVWQYLQGNATEAMILGFTAGATQFVKQAAEAIANAIGDAQRLNEIPYIDLSGYTENKYSVIDEANNAIGMAMTAIGTADTAFGIAEATLDLTGDAAKAAGKAAKWGAKVTKYAKIGGKISKFLGPASLGVEIALIWTTFIMNAIMTGEFSLQAMAMAIAATVLAIVLFIISTIPVWVAGAIIAVIGLVDLILMLIGVDFSISGTATKYLAGWFYEERILTEIGDTKFLGGDQGLVDEEMGYVVGNRFIITDTFVGSIKQTANKGVSVTGGKSGVVGEGGVSLDRRALELSFICAEYVLDEDATVKDSAVSRNRCKPGQWRFQRTYNYTDKTVTFTNPMVIVIPFDRLGEHNLEYQTQIVARTTNYVSSMYGLMSGGYKNMTITLPKDMPKKKQWDSMELYLDILPNTVDGLWYWPNGAAANRDPDGDGLLLADELIMSVGVEAVNAYINSFENGIKDWEEGYADLVFSNWYNEPMFRAGICGQGGAWANFCDTSKTVPWLTWDYDGDGLGDKFEVDKNGSLGTDMLKYDTDGDGLNDGLEYRLGTRIDLADTDLDGLLDGEEAFYLKDDGTLNGGWDITVYKPGAVGPSGRYTTTVKVYSDPRNADGDGDGLSDLEEQKYSTSPNAYNRMPKVELTGSPFAASPAGAEAIYVKPGTNISFKATLQSFIPYNVAGTLTVEMPWHLLSAAQFTRFSGDSSPANTGEGGNPEWSFAADPLLPGEEAHTTITAQTAGSQSMTGTATIKLPLEASGWRPYSGGLEQSQYVSSVSALALDPTMPNILYAGGQFNAAGGRPASNIARWNGSSWAALGAGLDGTVYAAVTDAAGRLYVGGNFTHAGGQAANRIAKWTGTAWEALGDGFDDWVYGLAFDSGGNLYAVGDFTKSGTTIVNGVARWNGSSWTTLGSGVDNMTESWVKTIAIDSNDNVYIGGHFYSVSGVNAAHAARWNGSSWAKMGEIYGGGGLSGSIKTMAVNPVTDELYAGGDIWQIDSQDAKSGIFKWTGSNWQILPYVPANPDTSGGHKTNALTFAADGTLYAGGVWPLNGGGTQYLSRWDGSDWLAFGQPAGSSTSAYLTVNALISDGDGLTVGGTFDSVADIPAKNIAYYLTVDSQIQEDSVTVVVDAELPRIGLTSPHHGELIGGGVTDYVIGGFSGDVTSWVTRVDLSLPNASPTINRTPDMTLSPWAYTWNLPADGVYNLSAGATDFVGWTANPSAVQVMVDNTAPTANIDYPVQDQAIGPPQGSDVITITVTGSAADTWSGLTRVQVSTDDGPWREVWTSENPTANTTYTDHSSTFRHHATAAGWSVDWTLPNVESVQGYHSVKVRAFDLAGNEPEIQETTFIIDVIPPTDELTNRAYLYAYPHLPVGVANPLRGVANDVGNVPEPARPDELIGTLDSINNATIWLGLDSIADGDGVTVNWIGDFNGDRRGDLLVGTPASAGGAGRVNVVYGRSGDWTVPDGQEMISDNYTSFVGTPGAGIGEYALPAGDVNGDGIADLLVGDPVNNSVYVIFGKPFYYGRDIVLDGYQGGRRVLLTVPEGQQIGEHIGAAGDVNGDGIDDILIGATGSVNTAYLLLGMQEAWREIVPLEVFNAARISGAGSATLSGVGDLDGDFYDEFAVGLNGISVFNGKVTYANQGRQSLSTGSADLSFDSADAQPEIARLGDVTGDQHDDFIFTDGGNQQLISNGAAIHTYSYGVGFVAAPGDVDNDGLNDILIGGNDDAHLVLAGNLSGTQSTISGVAAAASTPYSAGSDLNSDGSSDLLLLPTTTGGVAANSASTAALPDLSPDWMPRLAEQNLSTFTGAITWSPVSGADAYVNGDGTACHGLTPCYTTIQAAVDARLAGDLIIVQPGVYVPFTVNGKNNMIVRGTDPDAVFVDAGGSGAAAHITNANGVRLEQMTLRNASYGVQLTNAGVGGHLDAELYKRAILDHLLVYDVSYDVYMDRSSTITVTRSTLVNGSNHVGVNMSDDFDATVATGWQADLNTPWLLSEGGGLAAISDTVYAWIGGGNGNRGFTHRDISEGESWSAGADSTPGILEPGSTMGAGPDGQLYAIGAPGWNALGTPDSSQIAADVVVAPNGHVFVASINSGSHSFENGAVWEWDGSQWITYHDNVDDYTPLGGNKYHVALSPTNGGLYLSGGWCVSDQDYCGIARWDGGGWEDLLPPKDSREMAFTSDGTLYATNSISGVLRYTGSSWQVLGNPANFGTGGGKGLHIDADDNIYVAGLASPDVYQYPYIGKWSGSSWTSVGYPVNWDDPATISALTTDADGALYVCGHFGDSGVAKNTGGSGWELLPAIPDAFGSNQNCDDIAFNGSIYVAGEWQSYDGSDYTYHNVMRWDDVNEEWDYISNKFNSTFDDIYGIAAGDRGIYVAGNFNTIGLEENSVTTNHIAQYHFFHGVYSPTVQSWSTLPYPPTPVGVGSSYAGIDSVWGPRMALIAGGGSNDASFYDIDAAKWVAVDELEDENNSYTPINITTGAMALGHGGWVNAIVNGGQFCTSAGSSWECFSETDIDEATMGTISGGVALAYDSKRDVLYALPGGNSRNMLRYDFTDNTWELLPADRLTPAGIKPGGGLVYIPGTNGGENALYAAEGNYEGGSSKAFYRYPLPEPNKIGFENSAVVVPAANSSANWLNITDPLPDDFNFRVGGGNTWFNGTGLPNNGGSVPTSGANPFLDQQHNVYRMGQTGYAMGYHTYTNPVTATTTLGLQAAINSGANRVVVQPGVYEEQVYLVNGVDVIGANPDWTIIRPPGGSTEPVVRAEGPAGASLSRVTLDGQNTGLNGLEVTGNAEAITFSRGIIYDTNTAILVDGSGSDLEVANATVALNTNGFAATNNAPVDVRNSIFAYNSGIGLSHTAGASPQLHTYNLFWENLGGHFGGAADAGAAELLIDPNFVDPLDHDYRTLNFSPVIDAGNPTDPAPPSDGNRADIGYVEQGRANFYVDDNYCLTCANDGLTWQVDAFDILQDALNTAQSTLQQLKATEADVPQLVVGVAAGTYSEDVTVPGHVLLMGSGAESTILNGSVTFDGVTDSGLRDFTVTGVTGAAVRVTGASNNILVHHNIIRSNLVGVLVDGRATAGLVFNTIANNTTGVNAAGPGSWVELKNNIVAGSSTGLNATGSGQIFSNYNLLSNTADTGGAATVGEFDLTGDPQFDSGNTNAPYRLTTTSPALDAASVGVIVPDGGGLYADLGYSELLAPPVSLLLGKEDLSTVMGNSGVASVEYAVVPVADPTQPVTATLPGTWNTVTLDTPGATYSYWAETYTPGQEGLHRFYSRATDMVDNTETDEADWYDGSFVADSTNPVVEWLSPIDGASLTAPLELRARVTDYAAGEFSVEEKDLYFEVGGTVYPAVWAAEPWDETAGEARVFRAWINPGTGPFTINAVAEDKAGNVGQSAAVGLTVSGIDPTDIQLPELTVDTPTNNGWVTSTVQFAGTASDAISGIASVEVSVDGGVSWRAATVSSDNWSLVWQGPRGMPTLSFPAQVRATDRAGNATVSPLVFTMDETPPDGFGQVMFSAPQETHFDTAVTLTIDWEAPTDGSGTATTLLAVDRMTDTIPSASVTGTTADRDLDANGEWYVHLGAIDAAGNQVVQHYGPWHVGIDEGVAFGSRRQSIVVDGFIDVENGEWQTTEFLDNDERNVGTNVTYSPDGPQSFYTTWAGDQFYLAWQGGWWQIDGTLWVYLNTGSGGGTQLITPLASQPTAGLPFAANYAVQITDPLTGTLWHYNGGWQVSTEDWAFEQGALGDTEIRLPLFGTSNVETLAFAQGDDGNPWAIFPASNPLTPAPSAPAEVSETTDLLASRSSELAGTMLARTAAAATWRSFHWDDLTVVTDPAANQPKAVNIELELDSVQSELVPWAPGNTLQYVVKLTNHEDGTLANQQIALVAFPGTALIHDSVDGAVCATTNPSWICTVGSVPPGTTSITLTTHLASGLSDVDEVMMIALLQNNSVPPELQTQDTIAHQVDSLPPEVIVVNRPFVKSGEVIIRGIADDGDGIGVDFVEIRPAGGGWQRAEGTDIWSADLTVSPFVSHGDEWRFDVRATDQYGQVSEPLEYVFTVDLQGPAIDLTLPAALSGESGQLAGMVVDGPTGSRAVKVEAMIDSQLWREAFTSEPDDDGGQVYLRMWDLEAEDGITHTIRVRAVDTVGNTGYLSQPQDVVIDNVAPQLTVTGALTQVVVQHYRPGRRVTGGPVISGTVTDGYEVASVQVRIEPPGGGFYIDDATLYEDGSWEYEPELTLVGTYALQAQGIDWLGNTSEGRDYPLIVIAAPDSANNPFITNEDTPIAFEPLTDDLDLDGDTLSISAIGIPISGTATISGSISIVYTPALNFNGTDAFTYTASDGALTDTATISITVLPVNDAPVISPSNVITLTISEDNAPVPFDLSLFGTDVEHDPLTWTVSITAAHGLVTLSPVAEFITQTVTITEPQLITTVVHIPVTYTTTVAYTPTKNYFGPDSFAVQVVDGELTDTVTISLTIEPVDDPPTAIDDPVVALRTGGELTFIGPNGSGPLDVLANDFDPEGLSLTITGVGVPGSGGTAQVNGGGAAIVYTPAADFTGPETFTYTVSDGGLNSSATVSATVVNGEAGGSNGQSFTATKTGTGGSITVTVGIPADVVTTTEHLALVYTLLNAPTTLPPAQKFAGVMFALDAYVNGVATRPFTFTPPITLTFDYTEADVAGIASGDRELSVWYRDGESWLRDGITIYSHDPELNRLVVLVTHLTDFGLFGRDAQYVYLPLINK